MKCDKGVIAKIYINNGTTINENSIWQQNLTGVGHSSLVLGDIDNDGDLDLVLMGCDNSSGITLCEGNRHSKIYLNNGTILTESQQWQQNLTGATLGSLAFGDIDNNGKLDLVLTGQLTSGYIAKIYINNGTTLTESVQWQQNLTAGRSGTVSLVDIDNDGDLDLDFAGYDGLSWFAKIYINNGTSLVESSQWQQSFSNWGWSENTYGDYDNDGDLDFVRTGTLTGDHLNIYNNNGTIFLLNQTNENGILVGFFDGSLAFADYDNDGDLDLGAMGRDTEAGRDRIYENNQTAFIVDNTAYANITNDIKDGSLAWLDLDNDTDLDLIMIGSSINIGSMVAKVYISNASLTKNNTLPSPPNSSFSSSYLNNVLTLSWGNGSDTETNTSGLYYNLRVGNATNNNSIVSGVYGGSSNPTAGYFGNMMQRKNIALNVQLEANKTYYWAVQTIDTGLSKSNWSIMQNFTTAIDVTKPNVTVNEPSPNESLHTTNPYFIFNITVTDADLTNVTLYANFNGTMLANETNSSGINGNYVFIRNLTNYNDSQYSWYIYACDGNNNCQTSGRSFYLDRSAPVVRAISPADGASWTSSNVVTFSYNVSDVDIANCSLIVNNAIVNTSTSVSENIEQNFIYSLSNGNYSWQVNCTDYVGYTNSSSIYSLTVNYVAPISSGGGSSGGGTAVTSKTYIITDEQFTQGFIKELSINDQIKFSIKNETHYVKIIAVTNTTATINVSSITQQATLFIGEEKKFELTKDSYYDLSVKLNGIENNKANLTIQGIYEEIKIREEKPEEKEEASEIAEEEKKGEIGGKETENLPSWIILTAFVIIILIVISVILLRKYLKYKTWKKWSLLR